jgi:hypothetical protein
MSVDERARATARRTSAAVTAMSDTEATYRELLGLHRRRTRAKIVALSAAVVAVLVVVAVGAGGSSSRRSEPIAPRPTNTKAFRAAPPFCGPASFGASVSRYVDVGGECPSGPGRYLSVQMGPAARPLAFTLPEGWTIQELGGVSGGSVMPALGGLLFRSSTTDDAMVLAEYPTELGGSVPAAVNVPMAEDVVRRLAARSSVRAARVGPATVAGGAAWRVDLRARTDATYRGHCVIGDRCVVTFGLARDNYPGRSYVGLLPSVPSTALVVNGPSGNEVLAWTWGDPDVDHALAGLLASIDLDPAVDCGSDWPCVH